MRRSPKSVYVVVAAMAAVGVLCSCSESSENKLDAATKSDAKVVMDSGQIVDTATGDAAAGDATPGDATPGDATPATDLHAVDGGATACIQSNDTCGGGLACHCCGAIGPKSICICTTTCTSDADCTRTSQPHCNKASPTATSGICTPPAFNCCWLCQ